MNSFSYKSICPMLCVFVFLFSDMALCETMKRKEFAKVVVGANTAVELKVPVGKVYIKGTEKKEVSAEALIVCNNNASGKCANDIYERINLSASLDSTGVKLQLIPDAPNRFDNISVELVVNVPASSTLDVDLEYGELNIIKTTSCINAKLDAGDIQLTLPRHAFKSAKLKSAVGDVGLVDSGNLIKGDRKNIIGATLDWKKGLGECEVDASVVAGNIQLNID